MRNFTLAAKEKLVSIVEQNTVQDKTSRIT